MSLGQKGQLGPASTLNWLNLGGYLILRREQAALPDLEVTNLDRFDMLHSLSWK